MDAVSQALPGPREMRSSGGPGPLPLSQGSRGFRRRRLGSVEFDIMGSGIGLLGFKLRLQDSVPL